MFNGLTVIRDVNGRVLFRTGWVPVNGC